MIGIILVNKPSGMTSSNVVVKIRHISKVKRVGHLGTLDPLASGVLPICLGKATRLFDLFLQKDKSYVAHIEFGKLTDSLDIDGKVISENGKVPSREEILNVLPKFIGKISQMPPSFSSKVINGVRAYKLARLGQEVQLKPCDVTITKLELLSQINENTYEFLVSCSSGTYIRSLARDIAEALGTQGTISKLTRVQSGDFIIENCIDLDKISNENIKDNLISLETVLEKFNKIELSKKNVENIFNGKVVLLDGYQDGIYVLTYENKVVALGKVNNNQLRMQTSLKED